MEGLTGLLLKVEQDEEIKGVQYSVTTKLTPDGKFIIHTRFYSSLSPTPSVFISSRFGYFKVKIYQV
jgi:hypothetical protein